MRKKIISKHRSIKVHIFGQTLISISSALSQKNEIENWSLITSAQCILYITAFGFGFQNAKQLQINYTLKAP